MVHRRVGRLLAASAALLAVGLALPAATAADSRRISISNYAWSDDRVEIDRGEHVTWYWVGPDTMHSITGFNAAAGLDSDPDTNQPKHRVGDSFRLDFDQPGVYEFQCKLHSTVNGTVTVSDVPGDPAGEPDPVPKSRVDLDGPNVRDVRLSRTRFGRRGAALRYSIDERARIEIEYFRLGKRGKRRGGPRRSFAGYARHKGGHVGFNSIRFGVRRTNFPAKPGRYVARVRAIDRSANRTGGIKLRFRIVRR